jgi:hypothetical protein
MPHPVQTVRWLSYTISGRGVETVARLGGLLVQSVIGATGAEDGFAVVDAIVALTILSVTLVLCLTAGATARRAAGAAAEEREATEELRGLLESTPLQVRSISGRTERFSWSVVTTPTSGPTPSGSYFVCARRAQLVSRVTRRSFALATVRLCPLERPI